MKWTLLSCPPASLRPAPARRFRPRLEPLEKRALLTLGTFTLYDVPGLSENRLELLREPVAPGSTSTNYQGELRADFDTAANTIRFTGGDAVAQNSGSWTCSPGGANYGHRTTPFSASIRDLALTLVTSTPMAMTPVGEGLSIFPVTNTQLTVTQGTRHGQSLVPSHPPVITCSPPQSLVGNSGTNDPGTYGFLLQIPAGSVTFYVAYVEIDADISDVGLPLRGSFVGIFADSGGGGAPGSGTAPEDGRGLAYVTVAPQEDTLVASPVEALPIRSDHVSTFAAETPPQPADHRADTEGAARTTGGPSADNLAALDAVALTFALDGLTF